MEDGEEISFHGTKLHSIYTRGHANHHFCLLDPVLAGIFTGDSFGLAYPGLQRNGLFIFPSTSPMDFDPTAAKETLDIILASGAKRAFLTHFGELRDLKAARKQLLEHLNFSESLYDRALSGKEEFVALRNRFVAELKNNFTILASRAGLNMTTEDWRMVETDLRLNAEGIAFAGIKARAEKKCVN